MAVVHHYVLEKIYLDKDEDIITETYLYLDENKVKEAKNKLQQNMTSFFVKIKAIITYRLVFMIHVLKFSFFVILLQACM